jgi:hypothetical protein
MRKTVNIEIKDISYLNLFKVFFVVLISVYFLLGLTKSAHPSSLMIVSMVLGFLTLFQVSIIFYQTLIELLKYIQSKKDFYIALPYFAFENVSYSVLYQSVILPKTKTIAILSVIRI